MAGVGETRERSRWHTATPGRFPAYVPLNKLRSQIAQGLGEPGAIQREVNKLFRTGEETDPVTPHVITIHDVTKDLGLEQADEQKIQRMISTANPEFTQKSQTQRILLEKGRLIETLRSMKYVPPETRREITKRAMVYWKRNGQTDYGKEPTIRNLIIRKSVLQGKSPDQNPGVSDPPIQTDNLCLVTTEPSVRKMRLEW